MASQLPRAFYTIEIRNSGLVGLEYQKVFERHAPS